MALTGAMNKSLGGTPLVAEATIRALNVPEKHRERRIR